MHQTLVTQAQQWYDASVFMPDCLVGYAWAEHRGLQRLLLARAPAGGLWQGSQALRWFHMAPTAHSAPENGSRRSAGLTMLKTGQET